MWNALSKKEKYVVYVSGLVLFLTLVLYKNIFSAPVDFPRDTLVTIAEGQTLAQISNTLESTGVVQSGSLLRNIIILVYSETSVMAGDYFFDEPQSILSVARRITRGEFGLEPERITLNEGMNIMQMAELFARKFPKFDPERFLEIAEEGYMFPDTYFFLPNATAEDIVSKLRATFDVKIDGVRNQITEFGRPLDDVIKMASIVEKEARDFEDRRIISGILWTRFDDNYPLQVDVSFQYINGKNTYNLTLDDLASTSPYNSYIYAGLPPTPIANPGLDSIIATITPIESDYYFFLSDRSGNFYYSKNYAEHERKQDLYVR